MQCSFATCCLLFDSPAQYASDCCVGRREWDLEGQHAAVDYPPNGLGLCAKQHACAGWGDFMLSPQQTEAVGFQLMFCLGAYFLHYHPNRLETYVFAHIRL